MPPYRKQVGAALVNKSVGCVRFVLEQGGDTFQDDRGSLELAVVPEQACGSRRAGPHARCTVAAPARVEQREQAGDRAPVRGERVGVARRWRPQQGDRRSHRSRSAPPSAPRSPRHADTVRADDALRTRRSNGSTSRFGQRRRPLDRCVRRPVPLDQDRSPRARDRLRSRAGRCASNHAAARSWSCSTRSGSLRSRSAQSSSRSRWWQRYQRRCRSSGISSRFERSSDSSMRCGTGVADDRVAERAAQLREDRRVREEAERLWGHARKDLAARDSPPSSGRLPAAATTGALAARPDRLVKRAEVQADGPSLGAAAPVRLSPPGSMPACTSPSSAVASESSIANCSTPISSTAPSALSRPSEVAAQRVTRRRFDTRRAG